MFHATIFIFKERHTSRTWSSKSDQREREEAAEVSEHFMLRQILPTVLTSKRIKVFVEEYANTTKTSLRKEKNTYDFSGDGLKKLNKDVLVDRELKGQHI